jgi:IS5 family transposase
MLGDCVRVLTRLTREARDKLTGMAEVAVHNHGRRAKRRFVGIENAKKSKDREAKYKDLLKVTSKTVGYAEGAAQALERVAEHGNEARLPSKLLHLAAEIRHYLELSYRVIDQTQRRVLGGEHLPSEQKIVSIFEPHTDIIVKDRRDVYYGHKLTLSTGASGLVLDCVIEQGNPADSTLAVRTIERHKEHWGQAPRQASFDGGFASQSNLEAIHDLEVEDVVFSKGRGLSIPDMAKSSSVYKRMRRFRAGIEGIISFLKRCFGMWRCTYRGFESFKTYTWASLVSANLLLVARHQLG